MTSMGGRTRATTWLDEHADGVDPLEALAYFDSLPVVETEEMLGRWRGSGLITGSPLDGLLEAYGWYGKEFVDPDTVHPLLFPDGAGEPRPLNPVLAPVDLLVRHPGLFRNPVARAAFTALAPLRRTSRPVARARTVQHRGVATAAVVYDTLPVVDVLRRADADTLLGWMDLRGLAEPFLFLLQRDGGGTQSAR
jgi:hypothetical protein